MNTYHVKEEQKINRQGIYNQFRKYSNDFYKFVFLCDRNRTKTSNSYVE